MSAGGLLVDVAALLRRPNERRRIEREAVLDGLVVTASRVPEGWPIVVEVLLESLPSGIRASGDAIVRWAGDCRRCLEPVDGELRAHLDEIFEVEPTEDETFPIDDGRIDLEPVVREAVLLALPLAPLCAEDCRGPDPERFPAGLPGDAPGDEDAEPVRDPRWAALDDLDLR